MNVTRLTIFQSGPNNYKGKWFNLQFPGLAIGPTLHRTKVNHRDAAGVFSYLRQNEIWPKFQDTSLLMEDTLRNFDSNYP